MRQVRLYRKQALMPTLVLGNLESKVEVKEHLHISFTQRYDTKGGKGEDLPLLFQFGIIFSWRWSSVDFHGRRMLR